MERLQYSATSRRIKVYLTCLGGADELVRRRTLLLLLFPFPSHTTAQDSDPRLAIALRCLGVGISQSSDADSTLSGNTIVSIGLHFSSVLP
jgi:hypothetical protein